MRIPLRARVRPVLPQPFRDTVQPPSLAPIRSRSRAWCLAAVCLCLAACGRPAYRLDGTAVPGVAAVSLLDTSAAGMLDSVRSACDARLASLDSAYRAALDSLATGMGDIQARQARASDAHREARAAYGDAFSGLSRFRSFGGNPIFSDADLDVPTSVLLQEIGDRFYKGKAFSLETEADARHYIRDRLVPAERSVQRTHRAVLAARRSRRGADREEEELADRHARRRAEAVARHNEAIRKGLAARERKTTRVDSGGTFLFPSVERGDYVLYSGDLLPNGWLIPLSVSQHRRQDLLETNRRRVLLTEPAPASG